MKNFTTIMLIIVSTSFCLAGSLQPTGAPAPTMKTLNEVEPRTPIHASDLPMIINKSGSYYLAEPIKFSTINTTAITIEANDVTIDLKGLSLKGPGKAAGSSGNAIYSGSDYNRITVLNGSLADWRLSGLSLSGEICRVDGLKVENNGYSGIDVGNFSTVINCISCQNDSSGISASSGSTVSNCIAYDNLGDGIIANTSSVISNCSTGYNLWYGIYAGSRNTVIACSAEGNISTGFFIAQNCTVSNCTSGVNDGHGFMVYNGSTITGCTATFNYGDGINMTDNCKAVENSCYNNGYSGDAAGIHTTGVNNRIESNNVTNNDRGIDVDGTGSIIIKNSASDNTTNYSIAASNAYGQIITVSGVFNNTDPTANFVF